LVLAVNGYNESKAVVEKFVRQKDLKQKMLLQGGSVARQVYGVSKRPVYQLPNVHVTPHIAGATDGTSRKRATFAAENLARYARGEELAARVV